MDFTVFGGCSCFGGMMVETAGRPSNEQSDKGLGFPDVLPLGALFAAAEGVLGSFQGETVSWRDKPAEIPWSVSILSPAAPMISRIRIKCIRASFSVYGSSINFSSEPATSPLISDSSTKSLIRVSLCSRWKQEYWKVPGESMMDCRRS